MTIEKKYDERYKTKNTPWDIGKPDFNLIDAVNQNSIKGCKALDIGCGTGDNTIWLAQNGFQVIGTDTSGVALEKAKEKASATKVECMFMEINFLKSKIKGAPFGFVFDRGCFHSFGDATDRSLFAQNVSAHLEDDGLWLTIVGNADEIRQGPSPPQRSAEDIVRAVEPCFMILSLISTHFGSTIANPPRAWSCLMQKRSILSKR